MGLPINITDLVNGQSVEWDRIELKEGWNPETILHTIVAFANDINNWGGGYVVVGIEEKDGTPVLPPKGLPQGQLDKIQKDIVNICNRILPYYVPVTQPYLLSGKHIFILWVPGGDNRPYKAPVSLGSGKEQRKIYVRRGSATVSANDKEERLLMEMAKRIPFDDRVNHHASIADFDKSLIKSFLNDIKSDLYAEVDKIKTNDLVRQMHIASGADEHLLPINVGLLFFNAQPTKFFKGARTEVILYKDGESFTEKEFKGALHEQVRSVLEYISTMVIARKIIKQVGIAEALHIMNYPFEAVEEAVVNAFYHRSYELDNPIEINIWPDKIEILSFPGPLPPVDKTMLLQKRIVARDYRNRRIGDFLKELRLTEGRGTGIPKIHKAMSENGSPLPTFETDNDHNYFLVILPVHPAFGEPETPLTKTEQQILKFCEHIKSRGEIFEKIGFSNHTINYRKYISPLVEKDLLALTMPDKPTSPKQRYYTTEKGKKYFKTA